MIDLIFIVLLLAGVSIIISGIIFRRTMYGIQAFGIPEKELQIPADGGETLFIKFTESKLKEKEAQG